jgi:hypothetical protein
MASAYDGRIYFSTNAGSTWTELMPAGNTIWAWLQGSMSDDTQTMVAGIDGGRLYTSTNGGSSWDELRLEGDNDLDWRVGKVSMDGKKIFVGDSVGTSARGRLYTSTDRGASWNEERPAGDFDGNWTLSAMSYDGLTLVVGGDSGRLYIGRYPRPQSSHSTTVTDNTISVSHCDSSIPPSAPELFQINTTKTAATLYFSPPSSDTDRFYIGYGTTPGADQYGVEYLENNLKGVRAFTINALAPNQRYYFKVRGGHGCMPGPWGNTLSATTVPYLKSFYLY